MGMAQLFSALNFLILGKKLANFGQSSISPNFCGAEVSFHMAIWTDGNFGDRKICEFSAKLPLMKQNLANCCMERAPCN